MKISIYERSWHGIDFGSLPVQVGRGRPADEAFYAAFYAALKDKPVDPQWLAGKRRLGDWIEQHLLRQRHQPRVLAIATGLATIEQEWLALGYDVTLNDCSAESLQPARTRFPNAKILIGSINEMSIADEYEVVTMFAFDYALDDGQLAASFAKLRCALADGGMVLNLTLNVLSLRRVLAEFAKHFLGQYSRPGWVSWGWARSPSLIMKLAESAGLRTTAQFIGFDGDYTPRNRLFWHWLPLWQQEILMVFESPKTV